MITDVRASKMYRLLHQGESVASVSRRLKMSQKTVRKYRDAGRLPSQVERPERTYRTRPDPLAEFWSEIESLLQQDSQLKPYAILGVWGQALFFVSVRWETAPTDDACKQSSKECRFPVLLTSNGKGWECPQRCCVPIAVSEILLVPFS